MTSAPATGCLVGAGIGPKTVGGTVNYSMIVDFEQQIGRKLKIVSHFTDWSFTGLTIDKLDVSEGRIPLIAWKLQDSGLTCKDVLNGSQDAHIYSVATQLATIPGPSIVRFIHEMNIHLELGTPAQLIATWRYVRKIVQPIAPLVEWAWNVTARGFGGASQSVYPGDKFVDWISCDGYNLYPSTKWTSPAQLFSSFYTWAAPRGKPLLICESGCTYDSAQPTRQAQWVTDLGAWLQINTKMKAWCYSETNAKIGNCLLEQGAGQALATYKTLVNTPYMTP